MMVALLVITLCAGQEECSYYDHQRWEAPTMAELRECSDRADWLRHNDVKAACELVPAELTEI